MATDDIRTLSTGRAADHTSVLIAGGGIGGLTLATLLARAGTPVTLFEQAPEPADAGAGIQLGPNALHVLSELDLVEPLRAVSVQPASAVLRAFDSGKALLRTPLNPHCQQRYGQPYFHLHRSDLVAALVDAAEQAGADLQFGHSVSAIKQNDEQVQITAGASTFSGRALVAADGIRSVVRASLFGHSSPAFTGQTAWRALVPASALPDDLLSRNAHVWMGPGRHLVAYYVRGGRLVNLVAVTEQSDWTEEGWHVKANTAQLQGAFEGWEPVVTTLLRHVTQCYHWGLFDRPVPDRWYLGRTVLLGDACHPMLPFMAQGAAMAIEDAWVLANELDRNSTQLSLAFAAYQHRRRLRVNAVHDQSTRNARTYHRSPGWRAVLRNQSLRLASRVPALTHTVLDSIYGVKVTDDS